MVGHLDCFSGLNPMQKLARALSQLTNTYRRHVLFVAQTEVERETGDEPPSTKRPVEFIDRFPPFRLDL